MESANDHTGETYTLTITNDTDFNQNVAVYQDYPVLKAATQWSGFKNILEQEIQLNFPGI